jgi:integrase
MERRISQFNGRKNMVSLRLLTRIESHTFRATGITAYLKNKGTLEAAQPIANHESPRTTNIYERRQDEISLAEVERIAI